MKSLILLLLCQLTLFAAGQPLKSSIDIDATSKNTVHKRVHRALKPDPPICSFNQYFDKEEGRCLGVTGGGRVLYINSTNTCSIKALQPHCSNPRYYYICKNDKTILAECIQGQHFDNRLQKCVDVDPDVLVSSTVQPNLETFDSIHLPECKEPGSFPVPDDCTLFYTCETNGHRMFQSVFRCPKDMAYDAETELCDFSSSCKGTNLNIPFCAPVIKREHRNVKKPTNTESVTHITDKATIYEEITKKIVEDVTLANTVSVTTYDKPTSTFSYNNLTSTETMLVDETSSTERTSNHLHSSDTSMFTYSATSEREFLPTDQTDQFTETTTFIGSILETDLPIEGLSTENVFTEVVTSSTVDLTMFSSEEIPTAETNMIATEEIVEQSSTEFVTTSIADLSIPDNANSEVQTTIETEISDLELESSTLKNFELNEQSDLSITEKETVNVTEEVELDDEVTEPTEVEQDFSEAILSMKGPNNNDTNYSSEVEFTDTATTESTSEEINPKPISLTNVEEPSVAEELPVSTEHTAVSANYSSSEITATLTYKRDFSKSTTEEIVDDLALVLSTESLSRLTTVSLNENENSNILSTTSSYDANAEPEFLKNINMYNQSGVTKAPDNVNINANDKSIVQNKLLITTPSTANDIQESAVNLNTENVSNVSTLLTVSDSERRTKINSESLNKQLHSLVTDKQIATSKENDITEKESVTTLKTIPSTGRVSTDVILPIMSAVLRIIDMLERCLMYVLGTIQS